MTKCIAFHSYKGGTGKTTIAANLAAILAAKGNKVALVDLDVYAPSLQTYFDHNPSKWINDLLADNAGTADIMVDMTQTVRKVDTGSARRRNNNEGKLWVGFSNPEKDEIYKLEGSAGRQNSQKLQLLRKFIQLREELISKYECDYVIIDTSPGIRFWSINSLAIADVLFLTLKFGELDIGGTKKMVKDIYSSFTKFGAQSYALLNRVAGYCVPDPSAGPHFHEGNMGMGETSTMQSNLDFGRAISHEVGLELISAIPCYCDIQFSRKEFLTVVKHDTHPFAKQLERLAAAEEIKV